MPRAFRAAEKEKIKNDLLNAGEEMLTVSGVKKTSVDDLVAEVNIAKGSFYHFFPNKETLFLEIIEREITKITALLVMRLGAGDMRGGFSAVMKALYRELQHKSWILAMTREGYDSIARAVTAERMEEHMALEARCANELFELIAPHTDVEPRILYNAARALFFAVFDRREQSRENADEMFDFLLDAVGDKAFGRR